MMQIEKEREYRLALFSQKKQIIVRAEKKLNNEKLPHPISN